VGYPEIEIERVDAAAAAAGGDRSAQPQEKYYNSLLVVDEKGEVLVNYRKTFLFFTDETWASEGTAERGFHELVFNGGSGSDSSGQGNVLTSRVATSFGICMDINPYKFEAPFTAWEFANRVLDSKSQLVILSMAWTTFMSRDELDALADKPDLDTFNYWIQRFWPLVKEKMRHDVDLGFDGLDDESAKEKKIVIVFGNRCGEEGSVRYAGTSAIIAITQRPRVLQEDDAGGELPFDVKILCWDMLGATTEGICFADTSADPKLVFGLVKASQK
jgi:protein N-terminal amidase